MSDIEFKLLCAGFIFGSLSALIYPVWREWKDMRDDRTDRMIKTGMRSLHKKSHLGSFWHGGTNV